MIGLHLDLTNFSPHPLTRSNSSYLVESLCIKYSEPIQQHYCCGELLPHSSAEQMLNLGHLYGLININPIPKRPIHPTTKESETKVTAKMNLG